MHTFVLAMTAGTCAAAGAGENTPTKLVLLATHLPTLALLVSNNASVFKGPISYPFLDLDFPLQTPVKQPHTNINIFSHPFSASL